MATLSINVPDNLIPRLAAALRAQFPDLTAGKTDVQVARAVMALWLRGAVKTYAAQQVRQEQQNAVGAAEQAAWLDTEGIA